MVDILRQGGFLMWLIVLGGAAALTVFLERYFHLHRARIKTDDFLRGITNILRRGNLAEAISISEETPGPAARLVQAALLHREADRALLVQQVDDAALVELARLERRVNLLAVLAQTAPLLGVLGTTLGMIQAFADIQQHAPLVQIGDLAASLWRALLTTAAGLVVAIVSYLGYTLLTDKVDAIAVDMERAAGEILAFLSQPPAPRLADAGTTPTGGPPAGGARP